MDQPGVQAVLGLGAVTGSVDPTQVLGSDPGLADLLVDVAGIQTGQQPCPGPVGEVFGAAAQ